MIVTRHGLFVWAYGYDEEGERLVVLIEVKKDES